MRAAFVVLAALLLSGCVVAFNPSVNFCTSDGDIVTPKEAR